MMSSAAIIAAKQASEALARVVLPVFHANKAQSQKDFKSPTVQAVPATRKVRTHSDQLKCALG